MKNNPRTPRDEKREVREEARLTRPPRLEPVVQKAGLRLEKKKKQTENKNVVAKKPQWYSEKEMTDYQLPNKKR